MSKQQYNQNDKKFVRSISDDRALKKLIGDYYERKIQEVANAVLKDYNDSNYQDPKIKKQCLDRLRRNIKYYDERYNEIMSFLEGPKETVKKEMKKEPAKIETPVSETQTVDEAKTESPS